MLLSVKHSSTGLIVRVKLLNSSVTTGAGLANLSSSSSGLVVSTIADTEAAATVYTQAASNIESITTLGTYAAPTASKCRFREVDATNHKGVYELQFANARFSVAGAKYLLVSIYGATNLAECDFVIQLDDLNEIADAVLARDLGSGANAGSSQERTVRSALRFLRNKWAISAGVLTVYAENDTTSMWTSNLTTNAAADPVTTSDPA